MLMGTRHIVGTSGMVGNGGEGWGDALVCWSVRDFTHKYTSGKRGREGKRSLRASFSLSIQRWATPQPDWLAPGWALSHLVRRLGQLSSASQIYVLLHHNLPPPHSSPQGWCGPLWTDTSILGLQHSGPAVEGMNWEGLGLGGRASRSLWRGAV